jgi:hypothetical protein
MDLFSCLRSVFQNAMAALFDAEDRKAPALPRGRGWGGRGGSNAGTQEGAAVRKRRALNDRILFIDYRATDAAISFEVLGTTGNSYRVQFTAADQIWSCTCPDYGRVPRRQGHRCKHVFFVLARVLHQTIDDDRSAPPAFRTVDEVEAVMAGHEVARQFTYDPSQPVPPPAPSAPRAASRARRARPRAAGLPDEDDGDVSPHSPAATPAEAKEPVPQRPYIGDECCICYDKFTAECNVVFCEKQCAKTVHKDCFRRLAEFTKKPKCPYCRASMRPAGFELSSSSRKRSRRS